MNIKSAITTGILAAQTTSHVTHTEKITIGTPLSQTATKVLMCGAGELGKEVILEMQRLGIEVIAVDRYENAPGMQVAHRSYVISMLDGKALRKVIEKEKPHFIVPEIEALATDTLVELEKEGYNVIPSARATRLTMDREGIRRLVAEELNLKTSDYRFASTEKEYYEAIQDVGLPCVVKPIMSSSGKGQTVVRKELDIEKAWHYAQEGGRAGRGRVIVEKFIPFDYEITLLTVRHRDGTSFCPPIGHRQVDGDYRESWQPHPMKANTYKKAQQMAQTITEGLGGFGIFGVEFFIKDEEVYFSEVSPRPHDTGMVTMISQDLSEFSLHARAILGLPIPNIVCHGPSASCSLMVQGSSNKTAYGNLQEALAQPDTQLRLFGKPIVKDQRRMGVALARGKSIQEAREKATKVIETIEIEL